MAKKNGVKMSANDRRLISTTFDSNNLSSKISTINKLIKNINSVDITLMDSLTLKRQIITLKSLLEKSEKISDDINAKMWDYRNF